jgi:hypothetical protein
MVNWIKAAVTNPGKYIVPVVLLVAAVAHGVNMFHYPYYEDDEGTYMSQAWSLVRSGTLAPYTYTYDHAPGGWMLIALWSTVTGGFFTFGSSVNSGRVLMLILHLASAGWLYLIVKKVTGNAFMAALAILTASLSPLGIYYQRRVLLDNVMIFWVLTALAAMVHSEARPGRVLVSGLAYGIAIVTKETAVFLQPRFLYLAYARQPAGRWSTIIRWLSVAAIPGAGYVLYAALRGELFPYGGPLGGRYPHVSLIGTWIEQLQRPGGFGMLGKSLVGWLNADPLLLIAGLAATGINAVKGIRRHPNRVAAVFSLGYLLYLVHGGIVLEFYILPGIFMFALNIAVLLDGQDARAPQEYVRAVSSMRTFTLVGILMAVDLAIFGGRSKGQYNILSSDQTSPQVAAVDWVLSQNTPGAYYIIDNYAYVDLHAKGPTGHLTHAEYYWKVDRDPAVSAVIHGDWRNVSYILSTPQLADDIKANDLPITREAVAHSSAQMRFARDGWGVDILRVTP